MINSFKTLLNKLIPGLFAKKKHMKIGLYGPPNSGKCVTPDTRIVLQNGEIKTIQEIFEEVQKSEGINLSDQDQEIIIEAKEKEFYVPSLNPETLKITPKRISFVYAQKYKGKILKIKTRNGREIKVTPIHPLIQISDAGIRKVKAQNLNLKDTIAICKNLELTSSLEIPAISQEIFVEKNGMIQSKCKFHYPKEIQYPKAIDSDLVRFIGYVITESNHGKSRIKFSNTEGNLLRDFTELSYKIFNTKPIFRINKGVAELEINSKTLTDYLRYNVNLEPHLSGEKKIPHQFMGMPKNLTSELLRVLFDCEGSIPDRKGVKNSGKEIEFCSKSKILVEQVQLLLNRYGIVGKFLKKTVNDQEYWRLLISGSDQHRLFRDHIGFSINYKKARLEEMCKAKSKRNKFSLPIMNKLEEIRKEMGLFQREFFLDRKHVARMVKENRITYHRLAEMAKHIDHEFLRTVAHADTMWDEIRSIEEIDYNGYIYDLTIEDNHTFLISNGLIAHNTSTANRICKDWLGEDVIMGAVSEIAHETREIQTKENIHIKKKGKELTFNLIDTPGIATKIDYEDFLKHKMNKKVAKERAKEATKGVIEAIKWLDSMDCVVVVLDATLNPYSQVNITIIGNLAARDIPVLIAANKIDLKKANIKNIEAAFPQYPVIGISAELGTNMEELYESIVKMVK